MIDPELLAQYQARSAEHYKFAIDARIAGMKHDAKHGALFAAVYSAWVREQMEAWQTYKHARFKYVIMDGVLVLSRVVYTGG